MAFFKKSKIKQDKIVSIEEDEEIVKFAKKSDKECENCKKKSKEKI